MSTQKEPLSESYGRRVFREAPAKAKAKKTCVRCRRKATQFRDEESAKEYQLSAFCQTCQDLVFGE